jgi:hypothetical protein
MRAYHWPIGPTVRLYIYPMRQCKLCSVKNCMNDLILNVALKTIYIYKEGGSIVPLNFTLNIAVIDIRLIKAGCNHYGSQ